MLDSDHIGRLDALAEAAEAYVLHAFGQHLNLVPLKPTNVAHFVLDRYILWRGMLNGRSLVVIAIRDPKQGATVEYIKHRDMIRRQLDVELALLLLDHVPNAIRRQMVERRIAFVAPGAQLYVPEALLDLRERASSTTAVPPDQISPTAQMLLLGYLLKLQVENEHLTSLADRFKVSIMSASRTLDELEALHLAKPYHVGRQRRLKMATRGRELWDAIQERLRSPVRKVRLVTGEVSKDIAPQAGESALAYYTMLATPRIETRAILSKSWKHWEEELPLIQATAFDDRRLKLETWTYDPQMLAENGVVDRLSLYLSVRESADERVVQAAEDLLETFEW